MEERKNKNVYLIIIIVLLLIIILGLVYMLFLKQDSKTSDSNKKDNNPTEVKDGDQTKTTDENNEEKVNEEIVNKLMDTFNYQFCNTTPDAYPETGKYTYDDLSDSYKYGLVSNNVVTKTDAFKTNDWSNVDWDYKYDGKEFDQKYYELFGYDKEIKLKNISKDSMNNNPIIANGYSLYFEDNNYYGISANGCGSGSTYTNMFKVIESHLKDNTLQITIKYVLAHKSLNDNNMYLYNRKPKYGEENNYIEKIDCSNSEYNYCKISEGNYSKELEKTDSDKLISKYSDKLDTYKYTFKYDKEHENYYFYSIEKIK